MLPVTPGRTGWAAWSQGQADSSRARHVFRTKRLDREQTANNERLAAKASAKLKEIEAASAGSEEEKREQARKKVTPKVPQAREQEELGMPGLRIA